MIRSNRKLFLQEKPAKILLALKKFDKPSYTALISKEVRGTYAHALRVILKLKELGLVGFEKKGRVKLVRLSELGASVASVVENLLALQEVAKAGAAAEGIYEREVTGRLRAEINRDRVLKRLRKEAKRLENLTDSKHEGIWRHTRRCLERIEEIEREVTGLIVG